MTTTVNTINGNEGNNRLTGTSRNDVINGNGGNDRLSGGSGADTLNGGAGKDELNGGSGNDVLDGGSGSDELEGGSGNDTLIYTFAENNVIGRMTYDEYEGGSGTDTLELRFTRAEWMNEANQAVLQSYLKWASKSGSGCRWDDDFTFRFGNARLEIEDIEKLVVKVDNQIINNVGKKKNVDAVNDEVPSITEDATDVLDIDVLDNDSVNNLVKNLELVSSTTNGTVELVKQDPNNANTWYFKYTPNSTYYQPLNTSQSATETFTYRVTDADGDQDTATVTINITGLNDAAIISGKTSGSVTEDGSDANGDSSNNGGTPIATGQLTSSNANNGNPFIPVGNQFTTYGKFSITSSGAWEYTLDNTNNTVNALNAVKYSDIEISLTDSFKIYSADNTEQIIEITINGANDAAIIGDPPLNQVTEDTNVPRNGKFVIDKYLPIRDVDNESRFITGFIFEQRSIGEFFFSSQGQYIYQVNNNPIQFLSEGQQLTESFTVTAVDGTSKTISFTITGVNDAAVIAGEVIGTVTESGSSNDGDSSTTTGQLTINDIDNSENSFKPEENKTTTYGKFTITSEGKWIYELDNDNDAIKALNSNSDPLEDTFTIKSIDDTPQEIKITINGADDVVNSKPEIEGKGRVANVKELINLNYENSIIKDYADKADQGVLGSEYNYLHVRTGQFYVKDLDAADSITLESTTNGGTDYLGVFTPIFTGIKTDGKYLVTWTYEVKDRALDPLMAATTGTHSKDQTYTLNFKSGADTLTADVVIHLDGRDEIEFVGGYDNLNNVYVATDEPNDLNSSDGNDVLYLGDGDDSILTDSKSNKVVYGENGNETYIINDLNTVFFGGDGDDLTLFESSISTVLAFAGNGNDRFSNYLDSTIEGRKTYAWGGEGSDFFLLREMPRSSINWIMDFNMRNSDAGGDQIDFRFEETDFNWNESITNLEKKSADKEHPFLSEGAEYYELKVNLSADENNENWFSILNLVGIDDTEITLASLIANGNLV